MKRKVVSHGARILSPVRGSQLCKKNFALSMVITQEHYRIETCGSRRWAEWVCGPIKLGDVWARKGCNGHK